jgi:hypothetical protein
MAHLRPLALLNLRFAQVALAGSRRAGDQRNDWSTTFLYPKIIMPMIMIQCPIFKRAVPTGLTTENIKLDSLSGLAIPFQCPVCLKTHRWEREQAWVEEATI